MVDIYLLLLMRMFENTEDRAILIDATSHFFHLSPSMFLN